MIDFQADILHADCHPNAWYFCRKDIASCDELSLDQIIQSIKTAHGPSFNGLYLVKQIRGHLFMKQPVQKPVMNLKL